ncbi:hypothetical protein FMZ60_04470 [Alcaligenaceae bacterium SJ-26]|nr:hypothetical protein FMZ60_04470 [Alcaligenaceae bacterium SJ-26]
MPDATDRFGLALALLQQQRQATIHALKSGNPSGLAAKLSLDDAIACLQLCEQYGIHAKARITVLPETRTRTPSSEYRILEDHESEDRSIWTELELSGEAIRPTPGTLLLDCGRWVEDTGQ